MITKKLNTKELFESLDGTMLQLMQLIAPLNEKEINTIPFEESWTAAQLVVHVTKSNRAIAQALKQKSAFNIKIIDLLVQEDKMILKYSVTGNPTNEILNLAIVERGVENDVLLGENKGKKLHHDNVVRAFRSFPLQRQGELELTIPSSNLMKTSAVLYIQDATWKVITATSKSLH